MSRVHEPIRRPRSGADLAATVLLAPLAWVGRTAAGRRLLAVATVAVAIAGLVAALYAHPDTAGIATGPTQARRGAAERQHVAGRPGDQTAGTAEAAAVAWYARRVGVAPAHVRALQRQRVTAAEVRVLVIAELVDGRLPTALVTVRHGPAGWQVTS
jgi:hypothetical protein